MNVKGMVVCLFVVIFSIQFVSATFSVDWNVSNVKKIYNVGDRLSGTIVISFNNESIDSPVTTNLANVKIPLKSWLDESAKREHYDYNCSFEGCGAKYQAKRSITDLSISAQQTKLFGLKIKGGNINVSSISLTAKSSLSNTCQKQFSIDALNLGKYALENYKYTNHFCQESKYGCFDYNLESTDYQLTNLTENAYCEKIRLESAPAYLFGANLSTLTAKDEIIDIQLYDSEFQILYGNCSASTLSASSCIVSYPISQEKDYFVCISVNESNSPYQIRTEYLGSVCGTTDFGESITRDFEIFARPLEYSSDPIIFNDDAFALLNNEDKFSTAINKYLAEEYSSNCITQDCFIPFKILGSTQQQLSFSNVSLVYKSNGVPIIENIIYDIERSPSMIKSGKITLSLENSGLNVSQKNSILEVSIGNKTLFKTNVTINSIPITISPTFALIGLPTAFKVSSNETIVSAVWKFSNSATTKQGVNISYTFSTAGMYSVDVTATTDKGKVYTKSQQILVGEPRASAEELYRLSEQSLGSLSIDVRSVPTWVLPGIENKIDIAKLNNSLLSIKEKLSYAANTSEFVQIVESLRSLSIPSDLSIIRTGQFPIISSYGDINVDYASNLYKLNSSENLRTAITEWTRENYDGKIETNTYATNTIDGQVTPILTKVKISLTPKELKPDQLYLIIDYPIESIHFIKGYSQKELQSGTYLPISSSDNEFEFYIEDNVNVETLGIYLLPTAENLKASSGTYELAPSSDQKVKNIKYISLGVLLVFLIVIIVALQYWYRHNYEAYLFKDSESLFNVMTFVYNSKKQGLKEGDIRKNLLGSGWTREQINYALGRFEGKILGIFGLPLYSVREEEKVRLFIENRQRQNASRKVY